MARRISAAVAVALMLLAAGQAAHADLVLTGTVTLGATGGNLTGTNGPILLQSDGVTYWWADMDGNGGNAPGAGGNTLTGLSMGNYNITRTNSATGLTLDLDDDNNSATVGGAITSTGGGISTNAPSWNNNAGRLTITHAASVTLGNINTSSQNVGTGPFGISVSHTGSFTAGTVNNGTYNLVTNNLTSFNGNQLGTQTVEQLGNTFNVTSIDAQKTNLGGDVSGTRVTIQNYQTVAVTGSFSLSPTANGSTPTYDSRRFSIATMGSGDVIITGIGSGGVTLQTTDGLNGGINTGGYICNQDLNWHTHAGNVQISAAGPVVIHHLVTGFGDAYYSMYKAGNATINGSSIEISGDINLYNAYGASYLGTLSLTAATRIDVGAMDCSQFAAPTSGTVNYTFDVTAGQGGNLYSYINGLLTNITVSGGNETKLYIPTGNTVWYNDSLANTGSGFTNGNSYQSLGGGWLKPESQLVPEPATLGFLALGGFAMAGAAVRRRRRSN